MILWIHVLSAKILFLLLFCELFLRLSKTDDTGPSDEDFKSLSPFYAMVKSIEAQSAKQAKPANKFLILVGQDPQSQVFLRVFIKKRTASLVRAGGPWGASLYGGKEMVRSVMDWGKSGFQTFP